MQANFMCKFQKGHFESGREEKEDVRYVEDGKNVS